MCMYEECGMNGHAINKFRLYMFAMLETKDPGKAKGFLLLITEGKFSVLVSA